jgi:hypothetical protein
LTIRIASAPIVFKLFAKAGEVCQRQHKEETDVSLALVFDHWTIVGRHREIGNACAHDPLLDDHSRHYWVAARWQPHAYAFAHEKRTISPGRADFFYLERNPVSFHLL